jgi:nonsense-mediated mRNA decay protein 3
MFCVECGKEAGDALIGGVCHPCFLAKSQFTRVPEHVDLEVCVHCHARKRGEVWLTGTQSLEPLIEGAILEAVEVDKRVHGLTARYDLVPEDEKNYTCKVHLSGTVEGVPFTEERATRSRVKNATCTRCSRIQGGYYEGVVQIRASKRDLAREEIRGIREIASRLIERIVADGDRNAFVLKDAELEGGLDITVGTSNAGRMIARAIAERHGGILKEHAKIAGRKDGVDIWRITFAIRLPEYARGDVVVRDGTPLVVQGIGPKNVTLRSPRTGKALTLERDAVEKLPVVKRSEARGAVVVSQTADEAQVLDPWTYETVTVLKPAGAGTLGEELEVVKWEGELVPLPVEAAAEAAAE